MPAHASPNILMLSNTQAKELAGRAVKIGTVQYSFQSLRPGPARPASVAYRGGGKSVSPGRPGRFDSRVPEVLHASHAEAARSDGLADRPANAPLAAQSGGGARALDRHPSWPPRREIDFQFAAYLAKAVPGETWLRRKSGIADGGTRFPEDLRWRCVTDLLLALAALERAELVHGDLSPNNVIIDLDAPRTSRRCT